MADYYQLADYTLSELRLPYYRLPRAYFNWEQSFGRWFTAGVNTEAARFQHIDGQARPGGTRLDLKPHVSMPLGGASWFRSEERRGGTEGVSTCRSWWSADP